MNVLDKIREEGKLEGKLEGEFQKALETALKMQKERESLQKIIQYSGLSEDQLRENGIL
jgi:predicted transposase YdaD